MMHLLWEAHCHHQTQKLELAVHQQEWPEQLHLLREAQCHHLMHKIEHAVRLQERAELRHLLWEAHCHHQAPAAELRDTHQPISPTNEMCVAS